MSQTTPKRDIGLDILKGIGCLLMIVAHSNLSLRGYKPFAFHGGFAPALFFAVSGVTAGFQAARYAPRGVLLSYLFCFCWVSVLIGLPTPVSWRRSISISFR